MSDEYMGCQNPTHVAVKMPDDSPGWKWNTAHEAAGDFMPCNKAVALATERGIPAMHPMTINAEMSAVVLIFLCIVLIMGNIWSDWE